jgi:uncharacterized protein YcbK (DUF882 family)
VISAVGHTPHVMHAGSGASVADATGADLESFAGVLAGLMAPQPKTEVKVLAQADGTSELDQPKTDDTETGSVGDSKDAAFKLPASTSSTNDIVRSLAALDPQLQSKLARVASRMREETGHDVTISETYRSQARQDALYAQGRDADGPVVTWTKNSKHTQGRAVDVELDGGEASLDAYKTLQRIANEEGLRTLGTKDPGHLELRGKDVKTTGDENSTMPAEPADASGPGVVSVAHVARVARVAKVADVHEERPAAVARVAAVSQPGAYSANLSPREQQNAPRLSADSVVAPAPGAEAVARAERLMLARDNAPAGSLSQITMSVDGGNGTTDHIHLAMRGSSVNTTIDTGDARLSQVLNARSDELSRALAKDGIELQEFRVRTAVSTNTVTAAGASQNAQTSADASTHSRFDRGDAWQQQRQQQERGRQQNQQRQQRQQRGGRQ